MAVSLLVGVLAPIAATVIAPTAAFAVNRVVSSTADAGPNTLRQAVADAVNGDVITFQFGLGPVVLTSASITIDKNLTIRGNGAANTAVTRTAAPETPRFSVFVINGGSTVTLDMLRISNGVAVSGAGIDNFGTLTLSRSTVSGNFGLDPGEGTVRGVGLSNEIGSTATITNTEITGNTAEDVAAVSGGGVYNAGTMSLANSSVSNNTVSSFFDALGGGIANQTPTSLTLTDTIVANNSATAQGSASDGHGGGIDHEVGGLTVTSSIIRGNQVAGGGELSSQEVTLQSGGGEGAGLYLNASATINRSEISGNVVTGGATQEGGGVYVVSNGQVQSTVTITNTTIANNTATSDGGGLYNGDSGLANTNLLSDTVAGNISSGAALLNDFGTLSQRNTIVYNPGSATECTGTMTNNGNNLTFGEAFGTCPWLNADPKLGMLTDNGGVNQTMAIAPTSGAVDQGANCPGVDQRNYTRTGACDIGAFDLGGVLNDSAPPVCFMTGILNENPKKQTVTATDNPGRGVQTFTNITVSNGIVIVPFFLPRTNLTVPLSAIKANQANISVWRFNAVDQAGNTKLCQ